MTPTLLGRADEIILWLSFRVSVTSCGHYYMVSKCHRTVWTETAVCVCLENGIYGEGTRVSTGLSHSHLWEGVEGSPTWTCLLCVCRSSPRPSSYRDTRASCQLSLWKIAALDHRCRSAEFAKIQACKPREHVLGRFFRLSRMLSCR